MIPGQITIFELLNQSTNDKKSCEDCKYWITHNSQGWCSELKDGPCVNKNMWSKRTSKWEANEPTYQKWLITPDETFIFAHQPERKELLNYMGVLTNTEYHNAHHVCKEMPENVYAWLNSCNNNYFVFTNRGDVFGKQHDVCPYCGADLTKNEGDVILFKKHEKFWISHLYWDKPMHDKGSITEEERKIYSTEHRKWFGN